MQNSFETVNGAPVIPPLLLSRSLATHSLHDYSKKKKSHNHENIRGPFSQVILSLRQYFFTAECVAMFSSFYFVAFLENKYFFFLPLLFFGWCFLPITQI